MATSAFTSLSLADVAGHACGRVAAVLRRDLGGERGAIGDVRDHDLGALGGERLRVVAADALGAAGDDRGAASEPRHGSVLPGSQRRRNFRRFRVASLTMSLVA